MTYSQYVINNIFQLSRILLISNIVIICLSLLCIGINYLASIDDDIDLDKDMKFNFHRLINTLKVKYQFISLIIIILLNIFVPNFNIVK